MIRFFILIIALISPVLSETVTYSTEDFSDVQAAVNSLRDNEDSVNTLILPRGAYSGNLSITDNLIIKGIETAACIMTNSSNVTPIINVSGNVFVEIYNFTFSSANTAIDFEGVSQGNINNNVFVMGSTNIAINLGGNTSANVFNNTFHLNGTAIQTEDRVDGIINNVFSSSTNSILGLSSNTNIDNNLFIGEPDDNELGRNPLTSNSSDFVSISDYDFHHNSSSSDVVDAGANLIGFDSIDESAVDLGAYGGNLSDSFPVALTELVLSAGSNTASNFDVSLSWEDNTDYRVRGYFIYYDTDSGTLPYEGNLSSSGFDPSPLNIGNDVDYDFNNMNLTFELSQPDTPLAQELDEGLLLSWSSVTGADNYSLEYRVEGSGNNYTRVVVEQPTVTLSGLDNGVSYEIRVTAHANPVIYFAVAAYYDASTNLGKISDISLSTNSATSSTLLSSAASDNVSYTPNETVPFPSLPNNGGGCLLRSLK